MAFTIDTTPGSGSARLNIQGVFSAPELEQVIADLARARGMMEPAVPRDPERIDAHVERDPRFQVTEAPNRGGVLLRLRDAGVGWRVFGLPYNEAGRLGSLLDEWSRR